MVRNGVWFFPLPLFSQRTYFLIFLFSIPFNYLEEFLLLIISFIQSSRLLFSVTTMLSGTGLFPTCFDFLFLFIAGSFCPSVRLKSEKWKVNEYNYLVTPAKQNTNIISHTKEILTSCLKDLLTWHLTTLKTGKEINLVKWNITWVDECLCQELCQHPTSFDLWTQFMGKYLHRQQGQGVHRQGVAEQPCSVGHSCPSKNPNLLTQLRQPHISQPADWYAQQTARKDNFLHTTYTRLYWIPVCIPFHPLLLAEVCWQVKAESAQLSVGSSRRTAACCSSAGAWHWIKQRPNRHGLLGTTYYFIPLFLVDCQN